MAVSQWVEIALAALIFDQVLEKFPRLKVGVIELGAVWVPAWLERLEIVKDTFGRTESRIRDLPLRPIDYVRRQVRVTPYPTEDVGRLIERCGPRALHVFVGLSARRGRVAIRSSASKQSLAGCDEAEKARLLLRKLRGSDGQVGFALSAAAFTDAGGAPRSFVRRATRRRAEARTRARRATRADPTS